MSGIGPKRAEALAKLGVNQLGDLVELWPRRHRDRTRTTRIRDLVEGGTYTIVGRVRQASFNQGTGKRPTLRVLLDDGSGTISLIFFNAGWLAKKIQPGNRLAASGTVERFGRGLTMSHPDIEHLTEEQMPELGLIPIYPLTAEISQRWMSDLMKRELPTLLPEATEPLPESVRSQYSLPERTWALRHQHFPENGDQLEASRRRLVFDEFFRIGLAVHWLSGRTQEASGWVQRPDGVLAQKFVSSLPFQMTVGQKTAWSEIAEDLAQPRPMARLLQGDVGSGKTVVAVLSLLAAVDGGHQAAFMAPTELLCEQHYQVLARYLEPVGVRVGLLTGQTGSRQNLRRDLERHQIDVAVGTQALLSDQVAFDDLTVVVVDEQHRFGVRQRARLSGKAQAPDVLVMTATPIPRTMALTVFGDLEVSQIHGAPPGRSPITTIHLPYRERKQAYQAVLKAVRAGARAYVVCPLVNENPELELHGAVELAEGMKSMGGWQVGLVHGQLTMEEKTQVMQAFREGTVNVLVATSIIEVGVDVPEATVIVIENAERFGIAQLHQLRGRVGRGTEPSTCFLLSDPRTEEGKERLKALVEHQDGLTLAELDLAIRGPGEVLGLRQHGVSGFQLARPLTDLAILEEARRAARRLLAEDPELLDPKHQALKLWMLDAIQENAVQQVLS